MNWQALSIITLWENFRSKIVARKFVQNVGVLAVANFIAAALNFVQGILVARWLGPELYGVAVLVMTYPSVIYGVFDARSATASVKYLSEYHALGERDRALAMCKLGYAVDLTIACLTFLIVTLTARLAAESIANHSAVTGLMLLYGAALIPRALVGTSNAVLATLGQFPFIAAIEVTTTLLRVALIVGLVLGGWGVAGVVWANAVGAAAAGFLYWVIACVLIRSAWGGSIMQGRVKALKGGRREIFVFLAYNDLGALVGMVPKYLDVLLLGYFRNPTEVGYYKLAKSLSTVTGYLGGPLKSVIYPELARLWGLSRRRAFSQRVRQLAIWITLPLGGLVLLASGLLASAVPLLVGEIYAPAVGAAQLLFIGSAVSLSFFWLPLVYLAKGYARQVFILNSSVIAIFTLICPFAIKEWGYIGASAWMLALNVGLYAVLGFRLWKESQQKEEQKDVIWRTNHKPIIERTDQPLAESLVQEKT